MTSGPQRSLRLWYNISVGTMLVSTAAFSNCIIGRLRDQDPCFRAVVFSQFTTFLDLIQVVLEREGLPWYRFDGSMDVKKRAAAVSEFKATSRAPKIMVISLKAGGVGLNVRLANISVWAGRRRLTASYS